MRTFIAIDLSDEVRRSVASVLSELKKHSEGIRWTKPENVHVTLRFLGEIPEGEIPSLCEAARRAASRAAPFVLQVGKAATFGGKAPRVLLLDLQGDLQALRRLHLELEAELEGAGYGREARAFKPHLTVGRRKRGALPPQWKTLRLPEPTEWDVESLVVYESTLTRSGPVYTPLATLPLGAQGEQR